MNAPVRLLIGIVIATFGISQAEADVIFSLDASTETPGKQSTRLANDGAEFDVTISLELESAADSLGGYGFRVRYDAEELTLLSNTATPPLGFTATEDSNNESGRDEARIGDGTLYEETLIGAIDFRPIPIGVSGAAILEIATLRFRANDPKSDGLDDLVTVINPVWDGVFDTDFNLIPNEQLRFGSVTINAVPEPGAASLALLGLIFLAGLRSKSLRG